MALYYKFKSEKDYNSIPWHFPSITISTLKEKNFQSKHLDKGKDCHLVVSNAQTNEEYLDEAMLIPKNTSVLIRRVPGWLYVTIVRQARGLDGFGPSTEFGRGMDRRIGHGLQKKTPPPGYVCHRCKVPGHFIQHCPTNGDPNYDLKRVKPPTGIPRSMHMAATDGSYALPTGHEAFLKPNEAAFEKEIEGLPSTCSVSDILLPELQCPLCKDVMKDAVIASKCCFKSFCDKCIRDYIISNCICVCRAAHILADDLLPNQTTRDIIRRIMETGTTSTNAENAGSKFRVQDMESAPCPQPKKKTPPPGYVCHRCKVPGHFIQHCPPNGDPNYDLKRVKPPTGIPRSMHMAAADGSEIKNMMPMVCSLLDFSDMESAPCPQVKIPSPSSSALSKGEQKVSPSNEGKPEVQEAANDRKALSDPQMLDEVMATSAADVSEATDESVSVKEPASQGNAQLVEEEMQQKLAPREAVKKSGKEKARLPANDFQWTTPQDFGGEKYMMPMVSPPGYNLYWNGMQPGTEGFVAPYADAVQIMNYGLGLGPLDMPFGDVMPHDPFGMQNCMLPVPHPRDPAEFSMSVNTMNALPPVMSREQFEARKANLKRKHEIEKREERDDIARDGELGREVNSGGDVSSMKSKKKSVDYKFSDDDELCFKKRPSHTGRFGGGKKA